MHKKITNSTELLCNWCEYRFPFLRSSLVILTQEQLSVPKVHFIWLTVLSPGQ